MHILSLGQEDPLEENMATQSSILAWRTSWTEEPGGLQFTGLYRVGHDWSYSAHPRGGNSLLRYAYPTVKTLWDRGTQPPLAFRAKESKGVPWVAATRTAHQMCVKVPFWKVLALWSMADRGQRWCPPHCLFWKVFQQAPGCVLS